MRDRPMVRVFLMRPLGNDRYTLPITVPLWWAKELRAYGWKILGGENVADPYDMHDVTKHDADVKELERALEVMESRRRYEQWRAANRAPWNAD